MKKLLVFVAAIAMALFAQASELWWTVADIVTVGDTSDVTWDTATLYASANGYNFGGSPIDTISQSDMSDFEFWHSNIDDYNSTYSFYVELYKSSEMVGKSYATISPAQGATPYSALVAAKAINNGSIMNPTEATPYSFSSFTTADVIPEPTSGVLVLLGMMALGLKRKRV